MRCKVCLPLSEWFGGVVYCVLCRSECGIMFISDFWHENAERHLLLSLTLFEQWNCLGFFFLPWTQNTNGWWIYNVFIWIHYFKQCCQISNVFHLLQWSRPGLCIFFVSSFYLKKLFFSIFFSLSRLYIKASFFMHK